MPIEKRHLRVLSRAAGCALLAASAVLPLLLLPVFNLQAPAWISANAWSHLVMIFAGLFVFVPATLLGRVLLPARERKYALHLGRPKNKPVAVLFAGVAMCYVGNLATAFVMMLGNQAGVEFEGPTFPGPVSVGTMLLALVGTAVIPGVFEELLLRGVVMQPLRIFGDNFAIVCSAALFALIHMNMQQAPMAFVAGLALGWAAIRCGGLWIPILIHFWNNAAVVLLQFLQGRLSGEVFGYVQLSYLIGVIVLGAVSAVVLYGDRQKPAQPLQGIRPGPRALRYFFGSVPMVLAIAWFFWGILQMTAFS